MISDEHGYPHGEGGAPLSSYIPKYEKTYVPPKPKPRVSLAALQWAADRAGLSYGTFTLNLCPGDEARIQEEFEEFKRLRNAAASKRHAARVDTAPTYDEFIITDDDL